MGFDEEDVLQALKVAPFDKSAALDYLYAHVLRHPFPAPAPASRRYNRWQLTRASWTLRAEF